MQEGRRLRIMSGMRPTGRLHVGHLVGALVQWTSFSREYDAYFEIADLHALTTAYEHPEVIVPARDEMVIDWLASGLDPSRCTIFAQSLVPEISELHVLLSMVVPVSWLQRVPTYKEQIEILGPHVATYGFFGYPLLQLCDIAAFRADTVPVGSDQVSHLEFGREVVRRFNHLYGPTLIEAQPKLSAFPDVPGIDGRKMSKSYKNTIDIADDEATTTEKVRSMITDPLKIHRGDPGRPEICPVFALHKLCNAERVKEIEAGCRSGALGCVADKMEMADRLNAMLRPIRERRATIDPARVTAIIEEGSARARTVAHETVADVKKAMKL